MSLCFLMNKVVSIGGFFNVAMHFSVSYFGNFSISVKKKIHSVSDKHVSFEYLQTLFVVEMPFVVIPNIF